ncbi:MAG TPA: hypothetical protein VLB67_10470 [Acidimicrobiia bacterium]|nr:hypothetical protein [Acidimicrobiia bacterium]
MGWHTANQAVVDHTDPGIDDEGRLDGVEAIGVDEKRLLNATPTRRTVFTTQIIDLDPGWSSAARRDRGPLPACSGPVAG